MELLPNLIQSESCKAARREAEDRAEAILAFTQMVDYASHTASGLPYGYQRLLEIGIALAAKPEVLLIDEPTAGLNPVEVTEMMRLIQQAREEGITVVLVAHDMRLVMGISDRVLVLNYGKQIALDRPEMIRQDEAVISAYLGRQDPC
jgi:branched-chain amino acid transport system ATP-binding protein